MSKGSRICCRRFRATSCQLACNFVHRTAKVVRVNVLVDRHRGTHVRMSQDSRDNLRRPLAERSVSVGIEVANSLASALGMRLSDLIRRAE